MNKKFNIDIVKQLCDEIGCELVSTEYKTVKDKLRFRCPECQGIYERTLDNLKRRKNPICNSCAMRLANKKKMPSLEEVRRVVEQDGNKLISDKYKNCDTKIVIECECGNVFERTYYRYLHSSRSCGCDKQSLGSKQIEKMLQQYGVQYIKEYKFDDLPLKRFDFAIFHNNQLYCLIEYDGWFHYYNHSKWNQLERQQRCDKEKNDYCLLNNIKLIRIDYRKDNTEQIIYDLIQNIV